MTKAVKAVKATEVAVTGQFDNITEESIPGLLKDINARLAQLAGTKDKKSRLSGQLMGETLSEVKDVNKLMELYAYITKKGDAINSIIEEFKKVAPTAKIKEYTEEGGTCSEWAEAILERYAEITHEEELNILKETKKALEDCLSEQAKKKAKLEGLGATLATILNK